MTQEPTLTSAYWHNEFVDIKNPHTNEEFLRVSFNRTWVGLTDNEIEEVEHWVEFKEEGSRRIPMVKLVAYISNKLKEKNT